MNLLLNAAILNLWVGAHRGASEHHLVDLGGSGSSKEKCVMCAENHFFQSPR